MHRAGLSCPAVINNATHILSISKHVHSYIIMFSFELEHVCHILLLGVYVALAVWFTLTAPELVRIECHHFRCQEIFFSSSSSYLFHYFTRIDIKFIKPGLLFLHFFLAVRPLVCLQSYGVPLFSVTKYRYMFLSDHVCFVARPNLHIQPFF